MSTPVSELRHSLAALGIAAAMSLAVFGGLEVLALRAEASGRVYPYKWEDWLRYLTPTLWRSRDPSLLLTGPSTARENFLKEDFAKAFPDLRIVPGALSLGTFRDVTAGLEYIEREYGRAVIPSVMVMGVSPRFLAELPRERPLPLALARYSPRFGPLEDSAGAFGLARKPILAGAHDYLQFRIGRQSGRYWAAIAWQLSNLISAETSSRLTGSRPARFLAESGLARHLGIGTILDLGPREFSLRFISPYRYQPATRPMVRRVLGVSLADTTSWWPTVLRWDPTMDAAGIRARAAALIEFAERRRIELYIVSLPEHSLLRARKSPAQSAGYIPLVRSAFDSIPVLDLSCLLPDDEFLDAEHALLSGAQRISAHVIGFMNAVRLERLHSGGDRKALRVLSDKWSRGSCELGK